MTVSQGPRFQAQATKFQASIKKVGAKAVVGKNNAIAGGKYIGSCIGGVCKVAWKKVTGGKRSVDEGVFEGEIHVPAGDGYVVARFSEMEPGANEDDALLLEAGKEDQKSEKEHVE